jgi:DNA-directed RNA polymerase subunit K/omega
MMVNVRAAGTIGLMPTQAERDRFARWNAAARRADQRDDVAATMAERLEAVALLSAAVDELRRGVDDAGGVRRA